MSVYRVTEIIGTSEQGWEAAAREALAAAARSLRDLRVAEVVEQDVVLDEHGGVEAFRVKLRVSFKYEVPWTGAGWHEQAEAPHTSA
ncbi:MAG TPA: dodecin domain-containing protein [Phenylobacterium sp.]